jgi:hypothetical protein
MKRSSLHLAALALCSLVGCTDQGLELSLTTEQDAIVNGMISTDDDNAVVGLAYNGNGCTGTLIAPTVVLTALHCVTEFSEQYRFVCQPDGTLAPGSTTGQLGPPGDPSALFVRVGVQQGTARVRAKAIYGTGSTDSCHDDLAVVVLEDAPDIGDAPLVSVRLNRATRKKELTRIVGYGGVENTSTLVGRQERAHLTVRGVGGPDAATPGDPGVLPRTLQIGEGPCHGDSGGPIFSEETGAQIGVYSLLPVSTCTGTDVRNTYTLVAPFESLFREALASEGVEPILEPDEPSGAGGEGSEGGTTSVPSGGSVAVGGTESTGTGGSDNTGDATGEAATSAGPNQGSGTGSYRDSSCAYRGIGVAPRAAWAFAVGLVLAGWAARRRHGRA